MTAPAAVGLIAVRVSNHEFQTPAGQAQAVAVSGFQPSVSERLARQQLIAAGVDLVVVNAW